MLVELLMRGTVRGHKIQAKSPFCLSEKNGFLSTCVAEDIQFFCIYLEIG